MNRPNKSRHTVSVPSERSIESLIEELEQLQIQQAVVLDAIIERTGANNTAPATTIVNAAAGYQTAPAPPAAQPDNRSSRPASALHPDTYRLWDKVRINNAVRVNGRISNADDDYVGIVERLTAKYIHIRTTSGRLIRRAPSNPSPHLQ